MCSNIILGGAQLGLNYGITGCKDFVGKKNSHDILTCAKKLGISTVDIAYDYGKIFDWINDINPGLDIISKVKLFEQKNVENVLEKHLSIERLKYLLIHDTDEFLVNNHNQEQVQLLINFCSRHNLKWGISIYKGEILRYFLAKNWIPDLVQYPHNVLCAQDEIGSLCAAFNIATHIRSVLLQGLLIMPSFNDVPAQFRNNPSLARWYGWIEKHGYDPIDVCLRGERIAGRVKVLGAQNREQLRDLIGRSNGYSVSCNSLTLSNDQNLFDPRKWLTSKQ